MKEDFKFPRVGCAGIILNNKDEILLGLRIGDHGNNTWSVPGGHLEKYETPFDCIKREFFEETNINVLNCIFHSFTNDIHVDEDKHYITLFYNIITWNGDIINKEPDKCYEWKWFSINNLPDNLFLPLKKYIDKYKKTL